jgi:hypothetical protein
MENKTLYQLTIINRKDDRTTARVYSGKLDEMLAKIKKEEQGLIEADIINKYIINFDFGLNASREIDEKAKGGAISGKTNHCGNYEAKKQGKTKRAARFRLDLDYKMEATGRARGFSHHPNQTIEEINDILRDFKPVIVKAVIKGLNNEN